MSAKKLAALRVGERLTVIITGEQLVKIISAHFLRELDGSEGLYRPMLDLEIGLHDSEEPFIRRVRLDLERIEPEPPSTLRSPN